MTSKNRPAGSGKQPSGARPSPQADRRDARVSRHVARRSGRRSPRSLPDPAAMSSLTVAELSCDGMTANAIVRALGLPAGPEYLMQVKRALRRLGQLLEARTPVVRHSFGRPHHRVNCGRTGETRSASTSSKTDGGRPWAGVPPRGPARLRKMILEAARSPANSPHAGVAACRPGTRCRHLQRRRVDRLGDGESPASESALARRVRGERLLGSRTTHLRRGECGLPAPSVSALRELPLGHDGRALRRRASWPSPRWKTPGSPSTARVLVDRAALFICGVGTSDSGLMGKYFKDRKWTIPQQAVGDLAFNLVARLGDGVELSSRPGGS